MGITELIDKYGEAGVVFGFVLTWIIFSFQNRGMKDRIDGIETNINTRIDGIETNINTRIDGIETNINTRIDNMETNINTRIDNIETNINTKMEAINKSIEKHDTEQRELRGLVVGVIQSIGDIKQSIGGLEKMMASQQHQADSTPAAATAQGK